MIVILGAAGSGKSFLERQLCEKGLKRIISYTTRPSRMGEVDGVDYRFLNTDGFEALKKEGFFAEFTSYRGWQYGIAKKDCTDDKICVVEPTGFRQLKKIQGLNIQSFYLKVSDRERAIRMLKRGDDLTEVFRRIFSDQGSFNGIEEEVDVVLDNNSFDALHSIYHILGLEH